MRLERISNLKYVVRSGWVIRGVPNSIAETVAGHTFEVTLIGMYLADVLNSECDTVSVEKVLRMSLLHDVPEVVIGDIVKLVKSRAPELFNGVELEAMSELGLRDYAELLEDLNRGGSPEARLVKLSDAVATYLQGLRYLKTGYGNVAEIVANTKNTIERILDIWIPDACIPTLRKTLRMIGVEV
ncbi:MAG: HD family hydrolase [Zestosphaera sp.]